QNGKAERLNRTLVEGVRTVLHDAGLPKSFWAEALQCCGTNWAVRRRLWWRGCGVTWALCLRPCAYRGLRASPTRSSTDARHCIAPEQLPGDLGRAAQEQVLDRLLRRLGQGRQGGGYALLLAPATAAEHRHVGEWARVLGAYDGPECTSNRLEALAVL